MGLHWASHSIDGQYLVWSPGADGNMALTDAQIKKLKPKAGRRFSKADGGGLLLDITPGGVRSWLFRYRLKGKREKVVIGRYGMSELPGSISA